MNTEQQLLDLKNQIDKAKIVVSELTGQSNALLKQLEEWGCKTIQDAEKKLKEMEVEVSNFESKIALGVKELEEKYENRVKEGKAEQAFINDINTRINKTL